ncbi:hypothetical protein HPT27_01790 [Permianibacter sp. IMCC34836]|uniref:PD-(D/E)XK nuclease family protein n=1 Tax=Permianibacter fluminis TaxID=2738515 RepID=UPI001554CC45|nr:PD-(D/E)XK nuclease family protein [Permianibacter fluminis]NQD35734.1 hypothetical protein [Permianibacter fluminis]
MPTADPIDSRSLYQRLADGEALLVLAANRRLVLTLAQAYGDWQRQRGAQVWPTPPIHTFEQWLDGAAEALIHAGDWPVEALPDAVLDRNEELPLWQQLIEQDDSEHRLLSASDLAAQAADAHALLCEFTAPIPDSLATEEYRRLLAWRSALRQHCRKRSWLSAAEWRAEQVRRICTSGRLPTAIVLAGFDDVRPWLQQVLDAARERGVSILHWQDQQQAAGSQTLYRPEDLRQEDAVIARWCREQLQANPEARLAVVMPSLNARKTALLRALRSELEPANSFRFDDSPSPVLNWSLGEALADRPLVAIALRALRLFAGHGEWPLSELSPLLLSPYLGEAFERDARARLDASLREQGMLQLRPETVVRLLRERGCALLAERWSLALDQARTLRSKKHSLRDWSEPLRALLEQAGWPGSRALNSTEFQTREAFWQALAALARCRVPEGAVALGKAVSSLQQRCRQEVFQPQQPGTARVQVIGLLEAAAISADAIWVGDARDDLLPAPIQPNPLLPMRWQRSHNLPRSSHQRESQFAQQLMQRLTTTAPVIVWSCPQFDGERELRGSPFLHGMPESEMPAALLRAETAFHTVPRLPLESVLDDQAPPLQADEPIRRNSHLLAVQAVQPQAAFVEYRLHANAVSPLPQARQTSERGNLVHKALATLWQGLQSSSALAQLSDAELNQRCVAAADGALAEQARLLQQALPVRWRELEQQALVTVLREWLQFERQRQTPFQVSQIEQTAALTLAGLELSLRIDRVDLLSDGQAVVMDYKTGSSWQMPPWQAERPHEVQLMLYALATEAPLAAVVAARVRAGEPHFKGLNTDLEALPLKPDSPLKDTDLNTLREHWRNRLTKLAQEFVDGQAENVCYHPAAAGTLAAPFLRLSAVDAEAGE